MNSTFSSKFSKNCPLSAETRGRLLELLTLSLLLIQGSFTLNLWTGIHDYPQIPFFSSLINIGPFFEGIGLGLVAWACIPILVGTLFSFRRAEPLRKNGWWLLIFGLTLLIVFNQQRLQVWVWQIFWYGLAFATLQPQQSQKWLRWITVSIYAYSAISKFDHSFLSWHGQTLLEGLLKATTGEINLTESAKFWLTFLLPVGELLAAVCLLRPRTWKFGLGLSLMMHVGLLLALGPWGLNHHWPVLIWNLFFISQNLLLFTDPEPAPAFLPSVSRANVSGATRPAKSAHPRNWKKQWSQILLAGLLVFPAAEWIGYCDLWPGWGLYSAHGARVRLYVSADHVEELSEDWRPFIKNSRDDGLWKNLDLHEMSFRQVNAPVYPEDRFQLGVALCIISRLEGKVPYLVRHESSANRLTGKRVQTLLTSPQEIEQFSRRYFLNVRCRQLAND